MVAASVESIANLNEVAFRFGAFAIVLLAMAALEVLRPKRRLGAAKSARWITNFSILAADTIVLRIMALAARPIVATGAALYAEAQGWGLFNILDLPTWIEILLTVIILDFAIWLQHVASHKIPMLWRLHRVHHADVDLDVSTAVRFHPIEIALSMLWKVLWVIAFGAPAVAVLLFETILNGCAIFNHANVALPRSLDTLIRTLIVTPDIHRVHHSIVRREHDSNFGFNLSIWDRMFGTYTAQPRDGHKAMTIGLAPYQTDEPTKLHWSLILPFCPENNEE